MEEEEAIAEMEEVTTATETVVTSVTTSAVNTITEKMEAETDWRTEEEKEEEMEGEDEDGKEEEEALAGPEFVGEITEVTTATVASAVTNAAVDTAEAETEGDGSEKEEGQVKKLPGLWESEVRTFESLQSKIEHSERRRVRNQVINSSSFR